MSPHRPAQLPVSERYILLSLLITIFALLNISGVANRINGLIWDALHPAWGARPATESIIVGIDERSLATLGRWPWPRDLQAQLITALREQGAAVIVMDVLYSEPSDPQSDASLAAAMAAGQDVILPLYINQADPGTPLREWLPIPVLAEAAADLGHAHIQTDEDGIARGLALYQGVPEPYWPALAIAAARHAGHPVPSQSYSGTDGAVLGHAADYRLIPFIGPRGSVPAVSAADVLNKQLPSGYFEQRTVFVGATASGLGDVLPTPVSREDAPMPGVEIQANVYEALIHQRLVKPLSPAWAAALGLCWLLATVLLFPRIAPAYNLPLTLGMVAGVLFSTVLGVRIGHVWISPANTLVVILLAYPLWSWRRLIRLNRYLSDEIHRLAHQPVFSGLNAPDTASGWAQAIVELYQPRHWQLLPGETPEHGVITDSAAHRMIVPLPDATGTVLNMTFDPQTDPQLLAQRARHLERALLHPNPRPPALHHTGEVLEDRIARVQQAIDAMQQMRQFIGDIIAGMPDGILVTDALGRALYMNTRSAHWLRDDLKPGTPVTRALPVSDAVSTQTWHELLQAALVQGQHSEREVLMGRQAVRIQLSPLSLSALDLEGVVITFSDITPLHEAQQNRLETIHFISHDLRAPLASQLALLQTVEAVVDPGYQSQVAHLRALTRKSLDLADQFLQLARVEAAEALPRYPCLLADIVDNALDAVSPIAQQAQVSLTLTDTTEAGACVRGSADLLERALINLLTNAIKFSPESAEVSVSVTSDTHSVVLSVRDHGPGIAPEDHATLFQRFHRTRNSEQDRVEGSGLGLRFVAVVAERHEGRVEVQSKPGEGSVFSLILPAMTSPETEQVQPLPRD